MKNTVIATTALTLLSAACALPAAALSIAVLDGPHVIANTNAAKRASADLEKQRASARARVQALEAPLAEREKKLLEQRSVMAPDKFKAEEAALRKDIITFRGEVQKIQGEFEMSGLKARKQISDAARQAVAAIAKEKKYDLVVPKDVVIFSGEAVPDITAEALARTNTILK